MARKTFLTATSTTPRPAGDYPWYFCEWFYPHETIRREALRAERALERMENVVEYPWKAINFRTWIRDFYFPAIHAHHDAEERILGPHFRALLEKAGEDSIILQVWGSNEHNHDGLLRLMDQVEKQAEALCVGVQGLACINSSQQQVEAAQGLLFTLRSTFQTFKVYTFAHLEAEELVWPKIFERFGQQEVTKAIQKVIRKDMSAKGKLADAFNSFAGALLDNAACPQTVPKSAPAPVPDALHLDPWCSEVIIRKFLDQAPWIARKFVFPGFRKRYAMHWKPMIDSICSDKDHLRLQPDGSQSEVKSGCFCLSAS